MLSLLQKIGNGKVILVALVLTLVFGLGVFPHFEKQMNLVAQNPVQLLDMELGYSFDFVTQSLDNMNEEGRSIYRENVIPFDLAFPFVYSGLFIFLLAFLLKKVFSGKPKVLILSLVPLAIIVFDFLENFNTLKILKAYPYHTDSMVSYGSLVTQFKWGVIFIALFSIVSLLILKLSKVKLTN